MPKQSPRPPIGLPNIDSDNYTKVACNSALKLSSLWKKSKHRRLLAQPLTPGTLNRNADLFDDSHDLSGALFISIRECPQTPAAVDAFLQALLPYRVVATLATLMLWLQRQPGMLDMEAVLYKPDTATTDQIVLLPTAIWILSCTSLNTLFNMAMQSSRVGEYTGIVIQELDSISDNDGFALGFTKFFSLQVQYAVERSKSVSHKQQANGVLMLHIMFSTLYKWHGTVLQYPQLTSMSPSIGKSTLLLLQSAQSGMQLLTSSQHLLNSIAASGSTAGLGNGTSNSNGDSSQNGGVVLDSSQEADPVRQLFDKIVSIQETVVSQVCRCFEADGLAASDAFKDLVDSPAWLHTLLQVVAAYSHILQQELGVGANKQPAIPAAAQQGLRYFRYHKKQLRCTAHLQLLPECAEQYLQMIQLRVQVKDGGLTVDAVLAKLTSALMALGIPLGLAWDEKHISCGNIKRAVSPAAIQTLIQLLLVVSVQQQQLRQQHAQREVAAAAGSGTHGQSENCRLVVTVSQLLRMQLCILFEEFSSECKAVCAEVLQGSGLQLLHALQLFVEHIQPEHVPRNGLVGHSTEQDKLNSAAYVLWLLLMAGGGGEQGVNTPLKQGALVSPCPALTRLAADHPVEYFGLVDSCVRQGLEAEDIMLAVYCLRCGLCQPLASAQQLMQQPSAVAAVSSAIAGLTKLAAHYTDVAPTQQLGQAGADKQTPERHKARQYFPAVVPNIVRGVIGPCYLLPLTVVRAALTPGSSAVTVLRSPAGSAVAAPALCDAAVAQGSHNTGNLSSSSQDTGGASSSGGISPQAATSVLLLTVLAARSLLQLGHALDNAAKQAAANGSIMDEGLIEVNEQYIFKCVYAQPKFRCAVGRAKLVAAACGPVIHGQNSWINFQYEFVWAIQYILSMLMHFSLHKQQSVAAAEDVAAAVAVACSRSSSDGADAAGNGSCSYHDSPQQQRHDNACDSGHCSLQQGQQQQQQRPDANSVDSMRPGPEHGAASGSSGREGGTALSCDRHCQQQMYSSDSAASLSSQQQQHHGRSDQPDWSYLLRLHDSCKLTKTVASVLKQCPFTVQKSILAACRQSQKQFVDIASKERETWEDGIGAMTNVAMALGRHGHALSGCYGFGLRMCSALAAAAPLPLLCNNPGCKNLSGPCEAAVATKVCAACGTRWCSDECFKNGWLFHKKACRRMAALGLRVH